MKTKCISVKLKEFYPISGKCFKAIDYSGREDLIPASQFFGADGDRGEDSYWISEWILIKKSLQFSRKKSAWHDSETGRVKPNIEVITHKPAEITQEKPNQKHLFK